MTATAQGTTATAATAPVAVAGEAEVVRDRGLRVPLVAYAGSRALLLAVAAVVAAFPGDAGTGPWPDLDGGIEPLRVLGRWDSAWYLQLATDGYPGVEQLDDRLRSIAFFPLLPGLIAWLSGATGLPPLLTGLVVTTAAGAAAVVLVWKLVDDLAGRAAADRSAVLLSVFPGSFALSMVYSEGLLIAASAACLRALHRKQWVVAGCAAAVAGAARPTGVAALAACAVAVAVAVARDREWRSLAALAIAPAGIAGYFGYLWFRTGEPLAWFRSQDEGWRDRIDLGAGTFDRFWGMVTDPHASFAGNQLNGLVGAAGVVVLVLALVLLARWRPPAPVIAYAVVAIALPVMSAHVGPRPRMLLAAFPLVVAIAVTARPRVFRVVAPVSCVLLVVLAAVVFTSRAATP